MRQEGRGGIGPVDKIWRRQVVHAGGVARGGGTVAASRAVAGRWRRRARWRDGGGVARGGGTVAASRAVAAAAPGRWWRDGGGVARGGGGGAGAVVAAAPAGDVVDAAALCVDGRRAPCKAQQTPPRRRRPPT